MPAAGLIKIRVVPAVDRGAGMRLEARSRCACASVFMSRDRISSPFVSEMQGTSSCSALWRPWSGAATESVFARLASSVAFGRPDRSQSAQSVCVSSGSACSNRMPTPSGQVPTRVLEQLVELDTGRGSRCVAHGIVQGLTTCTLMSWKTRTLRVATAMRRKLATAEIWQSNSGMMRPAELRAATMFAHSRAVLL